jgi:hypothetical protein
VAHPPSPPGEGYVSIAEAARILGLRPWDVVRLIKSAQIETVELVEVASLHKWRKAAA